MPYKKGLLIMEKLKKINRTVAFILSFLIIIVVFPLTVSAENSQTVQLSENAEFRALIIDSIEDCKATVDVSKFNLFFDGEDYTAIDQINDVIFHTIPNQFNVRTPIGISYNNTQNKITKLTFTYKYSKEEYISRTKLLEAKRDLLLSNIKGNIFLTDVQKALLIHDRLIENCEYSMDEDAKSDINNHVFDAYGAIVNGEAVCEGYTLAYMYLLNQVGIKSRFCSSKELGHAWNIVTIGGKDYHVDLTYDDPIFDITGNVSHKNFLCSSDKIGTNHFCEDGTDYDTTPNDKTYDDAFWVNSYTGFQYVNGNIYYIDNKSEKLKKWNFGTDDILADVDDNWKTSSEDYFWGDNFSRLSTDGNNLYYSLSDSIYKFDLSESESSVIELTDTPSEPGYNIFGFICRDGYLVYEITDSPYYYSTTKKDSQHIYELPDISDTLPRLQIKDGESLYYNNGKHQSDFTGIVTIDNVSYYIADGKVAFDKDILVENTGKKYHANHGVINPEEEPLIFKASETEMYYINGGVNDTNYTGLFDFEGSTYYVVDGVVYYSEEVYLLGLESKNYCIKCGILDKTINGTFYFKSTGKYYDVTNGIAYAHTNHIGGTATCNSKAICSICGLAYGSFDKNVHTFKDNLQGKCSNCSYVRYKNLTLVNSELYLFDSSSGELDNSVQILTTPQDISIDDEIVFLKGQNICFVNGVIPEGDILVNYGNSLLHIKDGIFDNKEGAALVQYNNQLYYCNDGVHNPDKKGIVLYKNNTYSVNNGIATLHSVHNWDDGTITKPATCIAEGIKTFTCKECKTIRIETIEITDHSYQAFWSKDGNNHWYKCANCSATKDIASHIFDNDCDGMCNICGYTRNVSHNYVYNSAEEKNSNIHTEKCTVCNDTRPVSHSGGIASCTKKAVCTVCSEEYGELAQHIYETNWSQESNIHFHKCKNCDARNNVDNHIYSSVYDTSCNECGYTRTIASHNFEYDSSGVINSSGHTEKCTECNETILISHTGGTATCCDKAVCEVCGTSYGEKDKDNHTGSLSGYFKDKDNHWKEYSCCEQKVANESHEYDNNCDTTCNTCGNKRTVNPHSYVYDSSKLKTATTHTEKCQYCGVTRNVSHTGGTATCTKKAVCTLCGTSYGSLKAHSYGASKTTKATFLKDGTITQTCSCGAKKTVSTIYRPKTITLSKTSLTYTGKAQKPTVKVVDTKGKVISASYYTVTYKNNTNVGTATVTVTFKGNYSGTKNLTFKIVAPTVKAATISKVTSVKKGFKVTWKKQSVTGYEIQYSLKSNFKSAKTVKVTNYKTTSKSISKLTAKKKYYVRIRTYKKVGSKTFYSAWSSKKTVTTK